MNIIRDGIETMDMVWHRHRAKTEVCPVCNREFSRTAIGEWKWIIPGKRGRNPRPRRVYCSRDCMIQEERPKCPDR